MPAKPNDEEITELYEECVERSVDGHSTEFVEGVKQALGWIIGQEEQPDL